MLCRHYADDFSAARCLVSDEGEFLERPVDDRLGVEFQPVFKDGGVDAAEVDVGHHVTLRQILSLHRRILAVLAALHGVTDSKAHAPSTVVGPRPVVMHAAAKLREQEHEYVVCRIVLAQIGKEGLDRPRHLFPELRMLTELTGMRIEAAMIQIENPRPQVRQVHLCYTAQLLSYLAAGIGHRGAILLRGRLEDVSPRQGINTGGAEVIHHRAEANGRGIGILEALQHFGALLTLDARQHAVGFQRAADAGHGDTRQRHGAEHARAKAHACDHIFLAWVKLAERAAEPALRAHDVWLTGVPDVHGAEMRARRVGIANAMDDGHLALIIDLLQWGHAGIEAHLVIQGNDLVFGNVHRRAVVPIQRVGVRNDRIDVIIPTAQLQHYQNGVFRHDYVSSL